MASSLLSIVGLSKSFGQPSGKRLIVLQEVSLLLRAHDMMALMGPNGSGKTTLLNIIGGELRPDSGGIEVEGEELLALEPHQRYRKIGRVHQESYKGLAIDLTVSELLAIAENRNQRLGMHRVSSVGAIEEIGALSPDTSCFLHNNRNQPARVMSGGQRQFLCLALAVLGHPKLLLLDEHLASLDEQYSVLADELVLSFVQTGECAVLAVTHSRGWAEANCTYIGALEAGCFQISRV